MIAAPIQPAALRDARSAAWWALAEVASGRCERLGEAIEACTALDGRDAALARELALGVARNERLYDALADRWLKPGRQPDALRLALRLAAHQLFALDRIPPHAATNDTLLVLRRMAGQRLVGVANAVMRRLAGLRQDERSAPGPLGRLPVEVWPESPAVRHGLPDLLVADLRGQLEDAAETRLAALGRAPALCTRSRPGAPAVSGASILRRDGPWTWWDDPDEALRGPVAAGHAVVQDYAQGHVIAAAAPRPGALVLDVCAAPGGKALALADHGCRVIAADNAEVRLGRLLRTLNGAAPVLLQDGRHPALAAAFDAVFVDAPCSNTGVLGRRVEARWRYDRRHLGPLETLQRELLAAAAPLVAEGGKLVYSTCSVSPRENQAIAQGLPGWRLLVEQLTWPDQWQGGGYVAVLVRNG